MPWPVNGEYLCRPTYVWSLRQPIGAPLKVAYISGWVLSVAHKVTQIFRLPFPLAARRSDRSAAFAIRMSVRLSVRPSHSWGTPKWFKILKCVLHHTKERYLCLHGFTHPVNRGIVHECDGRTDGRTDILMANYFFWPRRAAILL